MEKKLREAKRQRLRNLREQAYHSELGKRQAIRDEEIAFAVKTRKRETKRKMMEELRRDPIGKERFNRMLGLRRRKRK